MAAQKIAVVTGAGSGVGKAAAVALSRDGFTIVLAGRRADKLHEVAKELDGASLVVPTDVREPASIAALFAKVKEAYGRLDLLFLPVWFLIPNLAVTALGFALLFGWSVVGSSMFGVALAIFHYEWVHYVAHIPYQPRTAFGRWIKQYHLRHHYKDDHLGYGISSPLWDYVFRTTRK